MSSLQQLPQDIFSNIMYRVSYEDFFNTQLISRAVRHACDGHLKQDGLTRMEANPCRADEVRYFHLCLKNGNLEATYRHTIYLFFVGFIGLKPDWAIARLEKLKVLGYRDSCYAIGIIHLLTGQKELGIKFIGEREGNKVAGGIEMCRESFLSVLSDVWLINRYRFVPDKPKCCTKEKHVYLTIERNSCLECRCDIEISHVWHVLRSKH